MPDGSFLASNLLIGYTVYVIATASPGPANMAIMSIAMHQGRRAALTFTAGVLTGTLFWATLASVGLSAVLATYSQLLWVMKILGGGYLLWLAWRAARSALRSNVAAAAEAAIGGAVTARQQYLRGVAMQLTNPKSILAWLSIATLALPAGASVQTIIALVAGCLVLGVGVFGGYALAFSTAFARRAYLRSRRVLDGFLAVVFGIAGIKLITSRL